MKYTSCPYPSLPFRSNIAIMIFRTGNQSNVELGQGGESGNFSLSFTANCHAIKKGPKESHGQRDQTSHSTTNILELVRILYQWVCGFGDLKLWC
jgi:hypothetical protein